MSSKIKIRASIKEGVTTVKALMVHPMETGLRKDPKTEEIIPANFIEEVTAEIDGKIVFHGYISAGLSKNPYLSFKLNSAKAGDTIVVRWRDNHNKSGFGEAIIKQK